jgi:hypothetical protein
VRYYGLQTRARGGFESVGGEAPGWVDVVEGLWAEGSGRKKSRPLNRGGWGLELVEAAVERLEGRLSAAAVEAVEGYTSAGLRIPCDELVMFAAGVKNEVTVEVATIVEILAVAAGVRDGYYNQ